HDRRRSSRCLLPEQTVHLWRNRQQRTLSKRFRTLAFRISIAREKCARWSDRDAQRFRNLLGVDREDQSSATPNVLEQTMYFAPSERDVWIDHDLNSRVSYG